ncbi:MAG: GAF domain-containing protein [Bryobacterales bacterium]|nr:GAF domain-containing protein [Acidobacteriota bacterium]MCB9383815.1 GAF domain-containing protein [Bryobacterales bacterium]
MIAPAPPADESSRLQTLHALGILDTPPEERFDRVVRLARRIFDVPAAVISLVDSERQWFKSCLGLDVPETPREISFCGHTILSANALVVEDAQLDPRFCSNPLVTRPPHIRFYAGRPLFVGSGSAIGSLCVLDAKPRTFTAADHAALSDLAAIVVDELKRRP